MAGLGRTIGALARAGKLSSRAPRAPRRTLQEVQRFGSNPGHLTLLSYLPSTFPPRGTLVVVLHGCTQSAEGYARGAGWIEAADRYGFALLCPEQSATNNPNVCFNWFVPEDIRRGGGEAASIAQMVRHMIAEHDIDPDRVFITGLSAGAAMANALLAAYPELFNAGAIIAGLPYGSASNVQEAFAAMAHQHHESDDIMGDRIRAASSGTGRAPRISVWHGDRDTTVSPSAGEAITRQWVNVHRAEFSPSSAIGPTRRGVWRSAEGEIVVEHHVIPGMGHGAPLRTTGPDPVGAAGPYLLDVGISSTLEILESWGVVQPGENRRAQPLPSTPVPQRLAPIDNMIAARTPRAGHIDVAEVINSALRAAGLMK